MQRTTLLVLGTALLVGGAVPVGVAGASSDDDQARADDAVEAFTEMVMDAGYQSMREGPEGDVLGLLPADDEDDPSAAAQNECLSPVAALVDDDGAFVGETARATSDTFGPITDETESTDVTELFAADEITAIVVVVEESEAAGLTDLLETLGSGEFLDCIAAGIDEAMAEGDDDDAEITFEFTAEPLELGDESLIVHLTSTTSFEGQELAFEVDLALARVDRALAIVTRDSTNAAESEVGAADGLQALVEALG